MAQQMIGTRAQHRGVSKRPAPGRQEKLLMNQPATAAASRTGTGPARVLRKSRWPARLDWLQSASGLALGLFMWGHMFFVSSILLGKDAMWHVTKFFEGYHLFGRAMPWLVSIVVAVIIVLFIGHALLAVRKFPINYRQYRAYADHKNAMRHGDTTLWWWQVITGFALFFVRRPVRHAVASGHDRTERRATGSGPAFLAALHPAVRGRLHAGIGLYRLAVKWGWFAGPDPNATRKRLKTLKWALTVFFLVLGFATLAAYIKIGIAHAGNYGQPYVPAALQAAPQGVPK
jgi:fumarate reductase subunit C